MSDIVIQAERLGKKYTIGHQTETGNYTALRDVLMQNARTLWNKTKDLAAGKPIIQGDTLEEVWALKDVSFTIPRGKAVGIIGRNGAGKSTLLKILSRITEPSDGRVTITGRVASLLEVGTGFHPELSGRENIYLNGTILGMTRGEIKKKFDEIVDFAEIEKYLDTPVKRYSSGMYVRLAFAVAAHLEPEILVVDEVLAVGDAQFQKKCLGKMENAGKEGRTILFVSHNMVALRSLCERVIWLNAGSIIETGLAEDVVSHYLQNGAPMNMYQSWSDPEKAPGNEHVRLHTVKITYGGQSLGESLKVSSPVDFEIAIWNFEQQAQLHFSVVLYDSLDVCIFNTGSPAKIYPKGLVKGVCHIPGNFLNDGIHRVRLLIVKDKSEALIDVEDAATFEVHDIEREGSWYGKWIGAVRPTLEWETETVSD